MNKVSFDLTGKTAVITGGGGVLCSELSLQLAAAGVKVAVLDLFAEKAQKVVDEISAMGGTGIAVECNVLKKESIEQAAAVVVKEFGKVDILVNGAGGNKKEATTSDELSFFDLPPEAIQFVFNLNFIGTLLTTQVFGKLMAQQGFGNIINFSSMNSFRPLTKIVGYSAAKASVNNFTQWMAVYFNQNYSKDIRVNAIAPGFLLTEQNYFLMVDEATGGPTKRGQSVLNHTPMNRYGKPEELAGAVIFLASDAASFVNGIVLPIDGGFAAYSGV